MTRKHVEVTDFIDNERKVSYQGPPDPLRIITALSCINKKFRELFFPSQYTSLKESLKLRVGHVPSNVTCQNKLYLLNKNGWHTHPITYVRKNNHRCNTCCYHETISIHHVCIYQRARLNMIKIYL